MWVVIMFRKSCIEQYFFWYECQISQVDYSGADLLATTAQMGMKSLVSTTTSKTLEHSKAEFTIVYYRAYTVPYLLLYLSSVPAF